MRRDFWNHDNGPSNVNLDNGVSNQNDDVGARLLSSPDCQDINGDKISYKLLQLSYDLVKWIYPEVNRFPKSQRLILSQRIELLGLGILGSAIKLTYNESKITRKSMLIETHKLQFLVRLSKDLSYLSLKRYEYISTIIVEILKTLDSEGKVNENLQQFVQ